MHLQKSKKVKEIKNKKKVIHVPRQYRVFKKNDKKDI